MNRAIKAALLSGLVFPGAGQIYLKKYGRGVVMLTLATVALIVIIAKGVTAAMREINTLIVTGQQPDINTITGIASSSSNILDGMEPLIIFLLACWIVSIYDAYRTGKSST